MIVAGIDPGLQRTGYAALRSAPRGRLRVLEAGIFTSDAGLDLGGRLRQIAGGLDDIPVRGLSATAIKKALTGNGRASKAQVQRAVQVTLGLDAPPEPSDVADAVAIALAVCWRTGMA